uniref:Uncharacterized protein n=1 Tax=Anguilla anguilla TaxID=7936 RepID=A0A0E9PHN2_ANGAN
MFRISQRIQAFYQLLKPMLWLYISEVNRYIKHVQNILYHIT